MKLKKVCFGFTLIEMMVTISILAVMAVAGTNMLSTIMKSANKANTVQIVKQNGNYALEVMSRMIRNAKSISPGSNAVILTNPDGGVTTFSCTGATVASNSASLLDTSVVNVSNCSFGLEATNPPAVAINFSLEKKGSVSGRPESSATQNFQTKVVLRNY